MKSNQIAKATLAALTGGIMLYGSSAFALPDLRITSMQIVGQARQGTCNTVRMTVRNQGNEFSNTATLDVFLATFPQGASNQNRAEKSLFISPLQANRQVQFNITNVEFKAQGAMTMQGLVDNTQEVSEGNENNNSRNQNVNVNGTCGAPPPRKQLTRQRRGCDLSLTFTQPNGNTIAYNQNTTFRLRAKNEGTAQCNATKIRLYRYNSSSASGYGSVVGGTKNIKLINALNPGATQTINFTGNPKAKGTLTYAPKFLGPWNDSNNNNHRPKKTVKAQ